MIRRTLDHHRQLHRRLSHLDRSLRALIPRPIHNIGPLDQLAHRERIKTEINPAHVRNQARARNIVRDKKPSASSASHPPAPPRSPSDPPASKTHSDDDRTTTSPWAKRNT